MSLNDNPAVKQAYEDRTYTAKDGTEWRRGLDGWFTDIFTDLGTDGLMLIRHQDFVDMIEKEHPKP